MLDRFHLRVWRWHFYAGLFTLPFLFVLAVTGAVYLYRADLEDMVYRDLVFVQGSALAGGLPASLDAQSELALAELPGLALKTVRPAPTADRTSAFVFDTGDGAQKTVFVDPVAGRVAGVRDESWNPTVVALALHGELMSGKVGDAVMELAASWTIILVASGLYLWWPRKGGSKIWGVLLPRLRAERRLLWRDLHSVTGFWMAGVLVFLCITGLFWSGVWGDRLAKPWSTFPALMYDNVPTSGETAATLNTTTDKVVPWAVETMRLPKSSESPATGMHGEHENHHSQGAIPQSKSDAAGSAQPVTVPLEAVWKTAQNSGLLADMAITLPRTDDGAYTVTSLAQHPTDEATLHIDRYSGEVLAAVRWTDYGVAAKSVATGIALHEGRLFGVWNQRLSLLACLLVVILTVSAGVLWWKRKPRASDLRAPVRVTLPAFWKGATAVIVLLAVLFPLAGLSLAFVLLFDNALIRHVRPLQRFFG